ncbi:hypothetical protein V0288_24340 [Pannus brasiliensis CCIBt3594]|uniref:Uncharacterized protein n=1 Tax=Pannus brasiliensis CCIBt3594 TaxID=1427578 RepID=A0AAW9R227_9CHRO
MISGKGFFGEKGRGREREAGGKRQEAGGRRQEARGTKGEFDKRVF